MVTAAGTGPESVCVVTIWAQQTIVFGSDPGICSGTAEV